MGGITKMKEITEQDRLDWSSIAPLMSESDKQKLGVKSLEEAKKEARRQVTRQSQAYKDAS
jgi:hypothetical protein